MVGQKSCKLHNVLYVPKLACNLISVTKAFHTGKVVHFAKSTCCVIDRNHKIVAKATKVGSIYQIDHKPNDKRVNSLKQKMCGTNVMV